MSSVTSTSFLYASMTGSSGNGSSFTAPWSIRVHPALATPSPHPAAARVVTSARAKRGMITSFAFKISVEFLCADEIASIHAKKFP
jgi:hypothetical protein